MRIFLIRHGESEANAAGILAGRSPGISLTENGRKQALGILPMFQTYQNVTVYSSPIQRCRETARLATAFSEDKILIEENLSEVDFGNWSGKKLEDLVKFEDWSIVQNDAGAFEFPEGESFFEVQERASAWLNSLLGNHQEKDTIFAFSHADIIKIIITTVLDLPIQKLQRFKVDPASVTEFEINSKLISLVRVNQVMSIFDRETHEI